MPIRFEWHPSKASSNLHKHGISFEESTTVFKDPAALIFYDEWHSVDEFREIIIGHSINNRLLLVSFIERNDVIRIISSRKATSKEQKDYEEKGTYRDTISQG